jgi:hypothetical protein
LKRVEEGNEGKEAKGTQGRGEKNGKGREREYAIANIFPSVVLPDFSYTEGTVAYSQGVRGVLEPPIMPENCLFN